MKKAIIAGIIVGTLLLAGCGNRVNPANDQEETTPSVTNTAESTQNKQEQNTSGENKDTEAATTSQNTTIEDKPADISGSIKIPDDLNETNIDQFFDTLSSPPQYYLSMTCWEDSGDGQHEYLIETWEDGDFSRMDLTNKESGEKNVFITDDMFDYAFNATTNEGTKMPIIEDDEEESESEDWDNKYRVVRKETLNGLSVIYTERVEEIGDGDTVEIYLVKDWILVEYGFPIFMKSETWIGDKKTSWGEMNEYKLEKPSKDIFKVPDTLELVDFGF